VNGAAISLPECTTFPPPDRPVTVAEVSRRHLVTLYTLASKQIHDRDVNVCKQFIEYALPPLSSCMQRSYMLELKRGWPWCLLSIERTLRAEIITSHSSICIETGGLLTLYRLHML
jgi:hypothetical protein